MYIYTYICTYIYIYIQYVLIYIYIYIHICTYLLGVTELPRVMYVLIYRFQKRDRDMYIYANTCTYICASYTGVLGAEQPLRVMYL